MLWKITTASSRVITFSLLFCPIRTITDITQVYIEINDQLVYFFITLLLQILLLIVFIYIHFDVA